MSNLPAGKQALSRDLSNRDGPPEIESAAPSGKGDGTKKESAGATFRNDFYTVRAARAIANRLAGPFPADLEPAIAALIDALDQIDGDTDFEDAIDDDREPWLGWTNDYQLGMNARDDREEDDDGEYSNGGLTVSAHHHYANVDGGGGEDDPYFLSMRSRWGWGERRREPARPLAYELTSRKWDGTPAFLVWEAGK